MCSYKRKKIFLGDNTTIIDGEYIMICNDNNDFSLYTKKEYDKLSGIISSVNTDKSKQWMRLILVKSELIAVKHKKLAMPEMFNTFIFVESFDVIQKKNHIRLVGHVETESSCVEKDLLEKIIENI